MKIFKMTLIALLIMTLTNGTIASAQSDTLYLKCTPSDTLNGFGIEQLSFEISNEDPDAVMKLKYFTDEKVHVSQMSYEGDSTHFSLIPVSDGDGDCDWNIKINKKNSQWKITVSSDSVDTFSVLSCIEQ